MARKLSEPSKFNPDSIRLPEKPTRPCIICGLKHWGRCDQKRLDRIEAARRGAETRLERYGTAGRVRHKTYSDQLADGFAMLGDMEDEQ